MEYIFSKYLENSYGLLKEIIAKLCEEYQYASVLGVDISGESYFISNKRSLVTENGKSERGYVFRVFKNGIYSEYSCDSLSSVDEVVESIRNCCDIEGKIERAIYLKAISNPLVSENGLNQSFENVHQEDMDCKDIIRQCRKEINDTMEDNEYIVAAKYEINSYLVSKVFLSEKKELKQVYDFAVSKFEIVVNKDDSTKKYFVNCKSDNITELLKLNHSKIRKLSKTSISLLDSSYPVAGEYECILSPSVSGILARNSFGHLLESDYFISNRSKGKLMANEKLCSYMLNVMEDNSDLFFFDDEGNTASEERLVDKGVLGEGIGDAISAAALLNNPTANGIRSSFKEKAYARSVCPYFESGNEKLDELIQSISYGFLLDAPEKSSDDVKMTSISISCAVGHEIKDGKLTGKIISPVIFYGDMMDIISTISKVSNNEDFSSYDTDNKNNGNDIITIAGGPYVKVKVRLG